MAEVDEYRNALARYLKIAAFLVPTGIAVGFVITYAITGSFGDSIWGAGTGFMVTMLMLLPIGQFGGPADPKFKDAREAWRRQQKERHRQSS